MVTKITLRFQLLLTIFGFLATANTAQAQLFMNKLELQCKYLSQIEQSYFSRHITYSTPSKNIESRTVDQFIKKMDSSKLYLLEKDKKQIRKMMKGIYAKTRKNDCSPIERSYDLYKARVNDRVNFAKKFLGKNYKLDKSVKFTFDPDERKSPVTQAQANNFLKKYIHFQVATFMATDIKLAEAKKRVIKSYGRLKKRVDDFTQTDLWSLYLNAFANSLDPHTSYFSAEDMEEFEIRMRLSLEGIGASLSSRDGFTVIEELIPGGSAAASGKLQSKDKIVAVATKGDSKFKDVVEMDLSDVVRLIRGKKGTKVQLKILRKKKGKKATSFVIALTRRKIELKDEAAQLHTFNREVNGQKHKIGLVNLPSFYADSRKNGRSSAKDVAKVIKEAKAKGVKGLVLDLSTNGGGSLDDAVKLAGLFFKKGNVVKQSSRDPARSEISLQDEDPDVQWTGPLVILVSRISASASEIVSGTLQSYKRAIVVGGDHTFGKGSVQSVEPLPRGLGALKTTVGMYYTAGGSSTQHKGVDSDIPLPSTYSNDDIGEKTLDYSLPPKRIQSFLSKDAYVTKGAKSWKQVSKELISFLSDKSKKRVATSKGFKKVKEDIAKSKKRGNVIKISEVLEGKDDDEDEKEDEDGPRVLTRKEREKKYLERADVLEAIDIMGDWLGLNGKNPMTIGKNASR